MTAISNLTPGPIAALATFAGYRMGNPWSANRNLGAVLPAFVLMFIMCRQYERIKGGSKALDFLAGVVPAVIGLILSAAVLLSIVTREVTPWLLSA